MANIRIPDIDYTTRDYEGIVKDLKNRIPFFVPEWTDHNDTDFGIGLVQLFAYVADILHFYIDQNSAEGFLSSAKTKKSVINLLKLIDYRLSGPTASTVDITFTIDTPLVSDLLIPKGTLLQTVPLSNESPVSFETILDLTILSGSVTGTVGAQQGQTFEENFTSDGQKNQRVNLSRSNILENTIQVFVTESLVEEQWIEVSTLSTASATDKVYIIIFDENNNATIEFGDGALGKIPINGSPIRIVYKSGGGVIGNVGANTITKVVSTILYLGNPITVNSNNAIQATGGGDGETIEQAKLQGPLSLRTLDRAVTLQDISTLSKNVSGVGKAKAKQSLPVVNRIIDLFIAPIGGGPASQALLDSVSLYLSTRQMAGTIIIPQGPKYISIDLIGTVFVKPNFIQNDVRDLVTTAIDDFFNFDSVSTDFGVSLHLADIYALIDNVNGVDYVDFSDMRFNPLDTVIKQVWSGNAIISSIVLNATAIQETITVTFFSSTQFSVIGSSSGSQVLTGVIGSDYIMDNGQVKIRLDAGINPMSVGDRFVFRSSKKVDNVILLDEEIRIKGTVTLSYSGGS